MKRLLGGQLWIPLSFLLSYGAFSLSRAQVNSPCVHIQDVFKEAAQIHDLSQPACQCFLEKSSGNEKNAPEELEVWIGCDRHKMPPVFTSLNALNETVVSKLAIWDSQIVIIPTDMFAQVRPRSLSIQRSRLSLFRTDAFRKVGQGLRVLQLRHNILNALDSSVLHHLNRLELLDLGGNRIGAVLKGQLDALKDLETLIISDNHLTTIEDNAFQYLHNLKTLNLANNRLSDIAEYTFHGLDSLEYLYLQGNNITSINWKAFAHLKNLRILDLGNNHLMEIELHGLQFLEKLLINNNNITSMKNVVLRDLRNLRFLNLDRNLVTRISEGDLHSLGESGKLNLFSLAYNQIETIETRSLEAVNGVEVLSLQDNRLTSLSNDADGGKVSILRSLGRLKQLFLENNSLTEINKLDFQALRSLKTLELDNNRIEKIDKEAFVGLPLSHVFLANNYLSYLPKGIFDFIDGTLSVIDLSGNPWQCICGEEWLPKWIAKMGNRVLHRSFMGCMWSEGCGWESGEKHSPWIAVIASVFAVFTLIILATIGFLFFEDGKRLRRTSSDLLHLIPNADEVKEPLYENDVQIDPLPKNGSGKKRVRFDGV